MNGGEKRPKVKRRGGPQASVRILSFLPHFLGIPLPFQSSQSRNLENWPCPSSVISFEDGNPMKCLPSSKEKMKNGGHPKG